MSQTEIVSHVFPFSHCSYPALGRYAAAAAILVGLVLAGPTSVGAAEVVGVAKSVEGAPNLRRGEALIDLADNGKIEFGDWVLNGESDSAVIIFKDDTQLSIGPNSEVKIDSFVFEPRTEKLDFKLNVTKGAFRYLSGSIAKLKPSAVTIETAAATIGIRGTLLLGRIEDSRLPVRQISGDIVHDKNGRPVTSVGDNGVGGPSFFVLRRDPNGKIGAVELTGKHGDNVRLDGDREASKAVDGKLSRMFVVSKKEIEDAFPWLGPPIEAPAKFTLFFETGTTDLTAESIPLLGKIQSEIDARGARLVSVVGHTDRMGAADSNLQLSIVRAESVRDRLLRAGVESDVLEVTSHGENNPAVETGDGVAEPRNRRVEVTVR